MSKVNVMSIRERNGKKILDERIEKSLKNSIFDAGFYSFMVGAGEQIIGPLAVALNATSQQIGLLTSIPQLLASTFQLFSADLVDRFKKRKLLTTWSSFLQALTWIIAILVALVFKNIWILIIMFSLEAIFGSFASPPWTSWMGDLVKENKRGQYFGKRNMIGIAVQLASFIMAGVVLQLFKGINVFISFAILFGLVMVSRLISTRYLSQMYEPQYKPKKEAYFSLLDFVKKMAHNNFGRFVIFLSLISFAVNFAGPFFTVYMLRDLKFSYLTFTMITCISIATQFISMRYWGKLCDRFGNRKIFAVTGFLVPLLPIMWLFSSNLIYLGAVQVLSGFVWAGFNLSTGNYFFDAVTPQKRARCVAYYNFLNGVSIAFGAFLGGFIAFYLTPWLFFVSKYQDIFLISGLMRFFVALFFIPMLKEVRLSTVPEEKYLILKLVALEPMKEVAFGVGRTAYQIHTARKRVTDGFFYEIGDILCKLRMRKPCKRKKK